jgi:RNA-directed DNA polymerase
MSNIFNFNNLLKAYYQCRKNKRRTINAAKFELNFETELMKLEKELKNKTYQPGRSICFAITEPKLREVFAADFRDRIVHHLLINYLEPIFEPKFIYHSYACRRGKGALKAVQTLQGFIRKTSVNNRYPAYYIHIDISAFFTSLNRDILLAIIERYVKNPDMLWLAKTIIHHDPTDNYYIKGDKRALAQIPPHKSLFIAPKRQGLPIGNLTSQFFANAYLNELDQYSKHTLKIPYYIRYVDDIIMLARNPGDLIFWRDQINTFLVSQLGLKLQPDKEILQETSKGMNFLGYIIKPNCVLMRNRTVRKLKNKLYNFNQSILRQKRVHPIRLWTNDLCREFHSIFASVNSYYGLFKHADTFRLRRHIYESHFGVLKYYLIPVDKHYSYFTWLDN